MKAAFLTGIRQIKVMETPKPVLQRPTDVLLRINTVGVCGSDMHYYKSGRIGAQIVKYPCTIGHECSGTIVEVGPAVTNVRPGDRVAVDPLEWCGVCEQCLAGRRHTCTNQTFMGCPGQAPGSLAEFAVWPAKSCFKIPDSMTMTEACLLEPFSIGLYAQRLAGPPAGRKIAILGSGPIGLCVLMSLKATGPCTVYQTDLLDNRLALASHLGADWTGNANKIKVSAELLRQMPSGFDCVLECVGKQETLDQAAEILKPGGLLVMVGIPEEDRISFNMNHLRRNELTLQNVRRQNECVEPCLELVSTGKVKIDVLATHHFTLDQVSDAFNLVDGYRDGVIKAMVHLAKE